MPNLSNCKQVNGKLYCNFWDVKKPYYTPRSMGSSSGMNYRTIKMRMADFMDMTAHSYFLKICGKEG